MKLDKEYVKKELMNGRTVKVNFIGDYSDSEIPSHDTDYIRFMKENSPLIITEYNRINGCFVVYSKDYYVIPENEIDNTFIVFKETILCISNYNKRKSFEMKINYTTDMIFEDFLMQVSMAVNEEEPDMFGLEYLVECFEDCETTKERWDLIENSDGENIYPIPRGWDGVRMNVSFGKHCVTFPKHQVDIGIRDLKIRDIIINDQITEYACTRLNDYVLGKQEILHQILRLVEKDFGLDRFCRKESSKEKRKLIREQVKEGLEDYSEELYKTDFKLPVKITIELVGCSKDYVVRFGTRKSFSDLNKIPVY